MFSLSQFLTYLVVIDFTPGPNTITAMSNSMRFGFKRTAPFFFGLLLGQSCIVALVALFGKALYDYLPGVKPYMLVVGAAYMLYLAYKLWHNGPVQAGQADKGAVTFVNGVLLQFVNVKFLLFVLTALSNYILPYFKSLPVIAGMAFLLPLGGLCSCCFWAGFGTLFCGFYNRHAKLVNAVMALALVYCAVALFF